MALKRTDQDSRVEMMLRELLRLRVRCGWMENACCFLCQHETANHVERELRVSGRMCGKAYAGSSVTALRRSGRIWSVCPRMNAETLRTDGCTVPSLAFCTPAFELLPGARAMPVEVTPFCWEHTLNTVKNLPSIKVSHPHLSHFSGAPLTSVRAGPAECLSTEQWRRPRGRCSGFVDESRVAVAVFRGSFSPPPPSLCFR